MLGNPVVSSSSGARHVMKTTQVSHHKLPPTGNIVLGPETSPPAEPSRLCSLAWSINTQASSPVFFITCHSGESGSLVLFSPPFPPPPRLRYIIRFAPSTLPTGPGLSTGLQPQVWGVIFSPSAVSSRLPPSSHPSTMLNIEDGRAAEFPVCGTPGSQNVFPCPPGGVCTTPCMLA